MRERIEALIAELEASGFGPEITYSLRELLLALADGVDGKADKPAAQ